FKGVATLFGSRTTDYHHALGWATITTFAGSLAALWVSQGLVKAFSGKGLVPAAVTADPAFLMAVGVGAALTVFLATLTGFPISTTHALVGALVGAGWMAVGPQVRLGTLGSVFLLPLVASPLMALALTAVIYPLLHAARARLGIVKQLCVCVGPGWEPVRLRSDGTAVLQSTGAALTVGERSACVEQYRGVVFGVDVRRALDAAHYVSAGAVGFARGLNDAPKIMALLVAAQALRLPVTTGLVLVAAAMAGGGWLNARRVAQTMSRQITTMDHGQGFTANVVTSFLVAIASGWGLPVSTTHVSVGALCGIGVATRAGRWDVIRNIALSWVITLPVAAACAALIYGLAHTR
ncbi:MAG: inorganic phosphate transporter, partial [Candidatus Omnitrophica bacterium]|nr:inorganic phosphate transporter [Candidatus Omnitrophota bacterium]